VGDVDICIGFNEDWSKPHKDTIERDCPHARLAAARRQDPRKRYGQSQSKPSAWPYPPMNTLKTNGQKQCKPSAESLLYAEVQPVFANLICKSSDNYGIIAIFAPRLIIVDSLQILNGNENEESYDS